jgi:hypothetical protein
LVKDALHGEPQFMVVAIDDPRVLPSADGTDVLSGREQRFEGFVSEHEQGSDRPQTGRKGLVATRRADPLDDLFAAEFLQIVCGLAGTVGGWTLIAERANLISQC